MACPFLRRVACSAISFTIARNYFLFNLEFTKAILKGCHSTRSRIPKQNGDLGYH